MLSAPSLRATITAAILVALTVFVIGMYSIEERVPVYDEHFYLETAINLAEHGIYGLRDPASGVLTPSGIGVPLYPAMVAAVMTADVRFKRAASCVLDPNRDKRDCGPGFLRLFVVQLALMSVLMGVLCAWLGSLFGSLTTGAGTVLLIGASGAPAYFSGFVLTEALYLPLAMLATVAWARAIVSGSAVWSVVCAVLFALATLSRPTFYYVFLAMLPLVVIWMGFATRSWLRGLGLTLLMRGGTYRTFLEERRLQYYGDLLKRWHRHSLCNHD